jgi:hypothetical protein
MLLLLLLLQAVIEDGPNMGPNMGPIWAQYGPNMGPKIRTSRGTENRTGGTETVATPVEFCVANGVQNTLMGPK